MAVFAGWGVVAWVWVVCHSMFLYPWNKNYTSARYYCSQIRDKLINREYDSNHSPKNEVAASKRVVHIVAVVQVEPLLAAKAIA